LFERGLVALLASKLLGVAQRLPRSVQLPRSRLDQGEGNAVLRHFRRRFHQPL